MKMPHILCILISLLLLGGCAHKNTPAEGTYVITALDGADSIKALKLEALYQDDRLSGKGPVNNWSTAVDTDGKLGIVITTRMAGSPERMELEDKFLQALEGGTLQSTAQGGLQIIKDGNAVIAMQPSSDQKAKTAD